MLMSRSGDWRWYFHDREAVRELLPAPEGHMRRAREIRNMEDGQRSVYAGDGVYFKWERPHLSGWRRLRELLFPRAKGEFKSLERLARLGIPAVEPLAYGVNGTESILITRAAEHTVTVLEYLRKFIDGGKTPSERFLRGWGDILYRILDHRLYIPDFHCGNLLYDEAADTFRVVDPPGMTRMIVPRRDRVLRMLKRQFGPGLEYFPESFFVAVISGHRKNPEREFHDVLEYKSRYVRRSQLRHGKRLRDLRRGRFTAVVDGVEMRRRDEGRLFTLENTEVVEVAPEHAVALWERDFVLTLYALPRLRIVGKDPQGKLYREQAGSAPVDPERKKPLLERLEMAEFDPADFDFATDLHGRTVLVDRKFQRR